MLPDETVVGPFTVDVDITVQGIEVEPGLSFEIDSVGDMHEFITKFGEYMKEHLPAVCSLGPFEIKVSRWNRADKVVYLWDENKRVTEPK